MSLCVRLSPDSENIPSIFSSSTRCIHWSLTSQGIWWQRRLLQKWFIYHIFHSFGKLERCEFLCPQSWLLESSPTSLPFTASCARSEKRGALLVSSPPRPQPPAVCFLLRMPSESRQAHLVGTLPQSVARSLRNSGVGRWCGGRAVRSTSSPPARVSQSSSRAIPVPRPSHQQDLSLHQGCSAADIPPVRGAGETEPPERRRRSQPPKHAAVFFHPLAFTVFVRVTCPKLLRSWRPLSS